MNKNVASFQRFGEHHKYSTFSNAHKWIFDEKKRSLFSSCQSFYHRMTLIHCLISRLRGGDGKSEKSWRILAQPPHFFFWKHSYKWWNLNIHSISSLFNKFNRTTRAIVSNKRWKKEQCKSHFDPSLFLIWNNLIHCFHLAYVFCCQMLIKPETCTSIFSDSLSKSWILHSINMSWKNISFSCRIANTERFSTSFAYEANKKRQIETPNSIWNSQFATEAKRKKKQNTKQISRPEPTPNQTHQIKKEKIKVL